MRVAPHPPHRSQHALLTHWTPASGNNAKTNQGIRMADTGWRNPSVRNVMGGVGALWLYARYSSIFCSLSYQLNLIWGTLVLNEHTDSRFSAQALVSIPLCVLCVRYIFWHWFHEWHCYKISRKNQGVLGTQSGSGHAIFFNKFLTLFYF